MGIDWVGADVSANLQSGSLAGHAAAIRRLAVAFDKQAGDNATRRDAASKASSLPQVLLGIQDESVPAATTESPTTTASTDLRITDFFVRDAVADDFNITSLLIGRLELIVGAQAPASMFRSSVQRPPVEAPILPAGARVLVGARNLSGAAKRFDGAFTGIDVNSQYDMSNPSCRC